jgi:hypothetical protein
MAGSVKMVGRKAITHHSIVSTCKKAKKHEEKKLFKKPTGYVKKIISEGSNRMLPSHFSVRKAVKL